MTKVIARSTLLPMLLFITALLSGCASTSGVTVQETEGVDQTTDYVTVKKNKDPFEKMNRSIMKFNLKADKYVLKPVAKAYTTVVPSPVRNGVRNFFSNLWEPMTVVNDLLQGKFRKAGRDTGRFVINTTLGFLGLNDVATHLGFPRQREDFGQTLAVWGVPSGPYLVLPFLGPSNLRDTAGLIPQMTHADAVSYVNSPESFYLGITRLISQRAGLFGMDDLLELQPDKYLFLRESYREARRQAIYDGNPPPSEDDRTDDELMDELLDDET